MNTKICRKCGRELPLTEEYFQRRKKGSKDGFRNDCKECKRRADHRYYESHKEIHSEKGRQYRIRNEESIRKYRKDYAIEHRDKIRENKKRYREENADSIKEKNKQYRLKNKDQQTAYMEQWNAKNKEHKSQYNKQYYKNNPERRKIQKQTRRAKKQELPATLTKEQWRIIKLHFHDRCCYCGKELLLEQDHFIPLSKNGVYTHNNIVSACRSCNRSKSNKDFFDWYPKQKFYSKKREQKILKFLGYIQEDVQQPALMI